MTEPHDAYPTITVICDQPSHARGKVAKIDTFVQVGAQWFTAEQMGDRKPRQHGWRQGRGRGWASATHGYECKLCGLFLECTDRVLQESLNSVAEQGESEVTLYVLTVLASRRT